MKWLLIGCVRGYQIVLSPLIAPACRFHPSCSEYAARSIQSHGWFRGLGYAIHRLLKCHPFHKGGYDPVK